MSQQRSNEPLTDAALVALVGAVAVTGVSWAAGATSAWLSGHRVPHGRPLGGLAALGHLADPSAGWHTPMGPVVLYWAVTAAALAAAGVVAYVVWWLWRGGGHAADTARHPERVEGLAQRREVKAAAGEKALLAQAAVLRPSLSDPDARDVGWQLGSSRGVACWMGARDSMVLLGPPGAGKGLHIVIPAVLDAPGALITTSTRPDNLTATMTARAKVGPVGVFDPQGLAAGVASALRWSPVRGCERPQTAMIRAAALTADAGESVTEGSFWKQQTATAVRCLLHAAAVGGKSADSLYEWSLSAPAAREAVGLLVRSPKATPHWDRALDAIVSADQRQRDSVWAMVHNTFAALADPQVLAAVSPEPDDTFDPVTFLRRRGSLFLLGSASGASATAGLVAALIEDVVEVARRLAAASPGARLDPPLFVALDEAANYPIPSLPALMSEGGGTGIVTLAVLQSLAQARERWGREQAQAIWDASTVKLVLGGSSNPDDLADISRMIGERDIVDRSRSYQPGGGTSWSETRHREAVLDPSMIRTLRFGYGLLLLRSARPIILDLHPWTARPDAGLLRTWRAGIETVIRDSAAKEVTGA